MITQSQSDKLQLFIHKNTKDNINAKAIAFNRLRDWLDSFECNVEIEYPDGDMSGLIDRKAYVSDGTFWICCYVGNLVRIFFTKNSE